MVLQPVPRAALELQQALHLRVHVEVLPQEEDAAETHGEALVDKDLAALCEEAVETVLPCLERVATTSDQTLAFFVGKFRKALSNTDEVTPSVLSFIKICQRLAGSIDGSKGNSIALEGQSADCLENITRTLELILN